MTTTRSTSIKKINYGLRPYQTNNFIWSVQYAQSSSTKQLVDKIPGKIFERTHLDSRNWILSSEILKYFSIFLSLISKISYLCFNVSPCSMSSIRDTLKTWVQSSCTKGHGKKTKKKKNKTNNKNKTNTQPNNKKGKPNTQWTGTVSPAQWLCQSSLLGHSTLTALTDALLEVQTDKSAKYCVRHILLFPTLSKWEEEKKTQNHKIQKSTQQQGKHANSRLALWKT